MIVQEHNSQEHWYPTQTPQGIHLTSVPQSPGIVLLYTNFCDHNTKFDIMVS